MKFELPEKREDPLHLLDVQVAPFDGGLVVRRGMIRMFLEAPRLGEVFDVLVDLTRREGGGQPSDLMLAVEEADHPVMAGLIAALRERRLLVPVGEGSDEDAASPHEAIFYWSYGTSATAVRERLAERRLAVIGVNHVGAALAASLVHLGFGEVKLVDHPLLRNLSLDAPQDVPTTDHGDWAEAGELPDCLVLAGDFGGPDIAREWNAFCVANGINFYPAFLNDHSGLVGPMVIPGQSACYECVALRERAASDEVNLLRSTDATAYFSQPTYGFVKPLALAVANLAATELLKFYSQALPGGNIGRLIDYDILTPSLTTSRVLKVPRCPVCSEVTKSPTISSDSNTFMPGNE